MPTRGNRNVWNLEKEIRKGVKEVIECRERSTVIKKLGPARSNDVSQEAKGGRKVARCTHDQ